MTEDLGIRPAAPGDLSRILEIEEFSFSVPWSEDTFRTVLARSDTDFLVATLDGSVVGYAILWSTSGESELANIAVAGDRRRMGIGSALAAAAVEAARRRGSRIVFLEVRESNVSAAELYRGMGFLEIGVRKGYYKKPVEDARVLALDIGAGGG